MPFAARVCLPEIRHRPMSALADRTASGCRFTATLRQTKPSRMSFVISDTISPVFGAGADQISAPPEGTNTEAVVATTTPVQLGGGTVTGSNSGVPGSATATDTKTYTTAAAGSSEQQQVFVSGAGTRVNVNTGAAAVQAVGGGAIIESIQEETDTSPKAIKLGDTSVAFNGVAVDNNATVSEVEIVDGAPVARSQTIGEVAGGQGGPFAFYAHGGFGNDAIEGSSLSDFLRGGAGNDSLNGFGGADLIRGGIGSDTVFGGDGADTLYYTADQFPAIGAQDTDTFADFVTGTDKISIDSAVVASTAGITGLGTNTISFSGPSGRGSVQVVSNGTAINASDINFI